MPLNIFEVAITNVSWPMEDLGINSILVFLVTTLIMIFATHFLKRNLVKFEVGKYSVS